MKKSLEFRVGTSLVRKGVPAVNGELLMERVWEAGYDLIEIDWEKAGIVRHGVEDEVIFLCDAYNELRGLNGLEGNQLIHLGDGVLEMKAVFSAGFCHVSQRYTPYLKQELMQESSYTVAFEDFVCAWERLICSIQELISKSDEKSD